MVDTAAVSHHICDFWHAAEYLGAAARVFEIKRKAKPGQFRRWWKHTTGDEVLQLRALQLSDRWASAVQRATRLLAKPVQIAAGVYAAKSTRTAPVTGGHGASAAA